MSLSVAVVWSIMGNGLFLYRLSLATGQHDQVDQDDRAVAHGHDFDDVGRVATGVSHSVVPWQTSEERRAKSEGRVRASGRASARRSKSIRTKGQRLAFVGRRHSTLAEERTSAKRECASA